ncbi:DUF805 domain-containing protein [Methylobacterium trifolii]|uniref:SHOCT domain-containing protein n=1 Tax=Methylobacterium trifolii TaxID=1003092 RepID=A0ABQ4U6S4_9HYPH|nr:DUF805 domain-containing protein [Methylobacterium trifolii]GJE62107.1 hypothetical protein MPOCJGCO_4237 [Methylobacterium trifolii]
MSGYRDAMRSYATFKGRTSHRDFLQAQWVFMPLVVLSFGVFGLPFLGDGTAMGSRSVWPILFFLLVILPHVVPWAALMVRRLHDMDHSGAWALLALIPLGFIVPFPLAGLVIWGTRPGTPWPNRFGLAPLGREPEAAAPVAEPVLGSPVPPTSTVPAQRDVIAEIERLAQLRASGALSETEFEVMKAQALGQASRA